MSTTFESPPLHDTQNSGDVTNAVQRPDLRLSDVMTGVVAIEILTIFLTVSISFTLYYWIVLLAQPSPSFYIFAAVVITSLVFLVSVVFGHYSRILSKPRKEYIIDGISAVGLAFSIFLTFIFLLKLADAYSRGTFFVQFLTVTVAIVVSRWITYNKLHLLVATKRIEARRIILIGPKSHCQRVMKRLSELGINTVAILPFPHDGVSGRNGACSNGHAIRKIVRQCRPLCPDDILVLAMGPNLRKLANLTAALSELPASLYMLPISIENIINSSKFCDLGPIKTIELLKSPLSVFDRFTKRTFDVIAAAIGLILLSPLFVMVAAAIKLDSRGPVFFRQTRHGFNNESIRVFKFRSMRTIEDGANFNQAVKNDGRVTKVGKIIRMVNIDELPQLINVLFGEMSMVGPRPHPIALNEMFEEQISQLSRRHNVKPGITGWAQINGFRGETDTLEKMKLRLEHDLYYIDQWSFLFDIQIIIITIFSKKGYSNAY
jgi:putative colanic acid biosynthesis UDP-glucose lipid carrier transferase